MKRKVFFTLLTLAIFCSAFAFSSTPQETNCCDGSGCCHTGSSCCE